MQQFLALTSFGVEILLAEELKNLNAQQVVQKPEGVYFTATIEEAYKICLYCRLSTRILLKLAEGDAENKDQLFATAAAVNWSEQFSSNHTFAIDFVGISDEIRNTQFGALTIKDALVDHFRDNGMERPSVDKGDDWRLEVHFPQLQADLYGLNLHVRFLHFLHGERRYDGIEALKAGIHQDVADLLEWREKQI